MRIGLVGWSQEDRVLACIRDLFKSADFVVIPHVSNAVGRLDDLKRCDYVLIGGLSVSAGETEAVTILAETLTAPFGCLGFDFDSRIPRLMSILTRRAEFILVTDERSRAASRSHYKVVVCPAASPSAPFEDLRALIEQLVPRITGSPVNHREPATAAGSIPRVSIVLPTHNGSRYLAKSIQSIIDQTYPDWELIVVDDCSSDSTPEIVRGFSDARIRCVRNENNMRLPRSLNRGGELARGEYLTWTSDDNWYAERALERMVSALDANPQFALVYAKYVEVDENDVTLRVKHMQPPVHLATGNWVGASFMYRRCLLDAVGGYDANAELYEDYDYWLRIARKFRIGFIEESFYYYRVHSESLTGKFGGEDIWERCAPSRKKYLPWWKHLLCTIYCQGIVWQFRRKSRWLRPITIPLNLIANTIVNSFDKRGIVSRFDKDLFPRGCEH